MRVRRLVLVAAAAVSLPAGCAQYDSSRREVEQVIREWRWDAAVVPEKEALLSEAPPPPRTKGQTPQTPTTNASRPVDTFVQEALQRNPGIKSAAAVARAKLERIPQVTALPDPIMRTVIRPEPIQTAAGNMVFALAVSQTIPFLAKLERAGDMAAAEARVALEQLNDKRIKTINDVERAYWQVYRIDRYLEITQANRRILEDLKNVVDVQYRVGKVQQQDLLRVQTELASLRDDEFRYGVQRSSAAAALNQLMDYPAGRDVPLTEPIEVTAVQADVDRLVAMAADHSPELAALREQIARDQEGVELAKLGYWPDVALGFEWNAVDGRKAFIPPVNPMTGQRPPINRQSESGVDNWAITVQWNLPIWWNRIEAAKRQAQQQLLASRSELRSAENLVGFRIFDAWSRVEAQQHTLRVLDTELIPQAQQTYEVSLTSYQAGESDFLTLIDNWQRWLDFELMRHRETVDLETAFSDLQREVGLQLLRTEGAAADPLPGALDDE